MGAGCAALQTEETVELELAAASARWPLIASLRVAVEANGRGVFASLHTGCTTARDRASTMRGSTLRLWIPSCRGLQAHVSPCDLIRAYVSHPIVRPSSHSLPSAFRRPSDCLPAIFDQISAFGVSPCRGAFERSSGP